MPLNLKEMEQAIWRKLHTYLYSDGFFFEDMVEYGLIKPDTETAEARFDRAKHRLNTQLWGKAP